MCTCSPSAPSASSLASFLASSMMMGLSSPRSITGGSSRPYQASRGLCCS
uniref:Alternative protein DUOX1 n=1 Tax=Homo sapiens TaxID=9606 RepID=L8ECP1_HUMAN|nr:alternative protein DUOX1 [Homo sapiens]